MAEGQAAKVDWLAMQIVLSGNMKIGEGGRPI